MPPGDPTAYHPPQPAANLAVDPAVLWGRSFLLDGPELEQALTFGDSRWLRRQVARLMAGAPGALHTFWAMQCSCGRGAWTLTGILQCKTRAALLRPCCRRACASGGCGRIHHGRRRRARVDRHPHCLARLRGAGLPGALSGTPAFQCWGMPTAEGWLAAACSLSGVASVLKETACACSCLAQFADWLRAAFPAANASVHNAGMAGTFGGVFAQARQGKCDRAALLWFGCCKPVALHTALGVLHPRQQSRVPPLLPSTAELDSLAATELRPGAASHMLPPAICVQCFDSLVPPADIYILEQATFDGTEPERCYCKDHYVNTPVQVSQATRACVELVLNTGRGW